MADEREVTVPKGCDWGTLKGYSGNALTDHYGEIVRKLREAEGLLWGGDRFGTRPEGAPKPGRAAGMRVPAG